jgi:exodeoxyribonuclease V alpha subunit
MVERITFHNAENGFCVLQVKTRGQRDLITVLGHAAMIAAGEFVQASGSWVNDRTHGLQFKASFLKATAPTTIEGIEKYLGSGMIRGIGPIYARKLVRAFGEAVFEIIEQEPGRLREVTGIGPKRAERIVAGWAEQKVIREIMLFLHSNGVGTSRAVRIYKTYGTDAVQLISENPYQLARDIRGIGFRTADQIAAKLGIEKTALIRVRAGISYGLAEAMDEGHCGLPAEELVPLAEKLLECPPNLSRRRCALNSTTVPSSPTISKIDAASSLRGFTEPSARSPGSSRRSPLASRPGRPLSSIRRSRGSSRGRSWRLPTAKRQRSGSHSSPR